MKKHASIPSFVLAVVFTLFLTGSSFAQQKIGYVDSEYILSKIPEYQTIQQNLDRLAQDWQTELDEMMSDLDERFQDYQAKELLYTNEERQRRRKEIMDQEEALESRRVEYFGPEGELYKRQDQMMRSLQERILEAMEQVAATEGFDYIFDISGDFLFMYAKEDLNMSDGVLEELGINVADNGNEGSREN